MADEKKPAATADEKNKKLRNITQIGSSVGLVAGLGYAFAKNKGFPAYVGYGLLFTVIFGTLANLSARAMGSKLTG